MPLKTTTSPSLQPQIPDTNLGYDEFLHYRT